MLAVMPIRFYGWLYILYTVLAHRPSYDSPFSMTTSPKNECTTNDISDEFIPRCTTMPDLIRIAFS